MCRNYKRCGCKGVKGSRKLKQCCKKVRVCKKYIRRRVFHKKTQMCCRFVKVCPNIRKNKKN